MSMVFLTEMEKRYQILHSLRAEENWAEVWKRILEFAQETPELEPNIVAEGAFALAQLGHLEQAEGLAGRVLQKQANVLAARALVLIRIKQGRVDEALKLAQAALQPPFKFTTAKDTALALLALASVYKALNDFANVRHYAQESIRIFPLATAFFLLGVTELTVGNTDQGLEALRAGLELSPKEIKFWLLLGNTYAALHRMDEMMQTYEQAQIHHPDNPALMSTLGEWYARLFRHAEAEALLRKVTQTHPTHLAGWVNLGKLLYDLGREDSIEALKTASQLAPDNAELMFNIGQIILLKNPKDSNCIRFLRKAYALSPETFPIAVKYAEICGEEGNTEEANTILQNLYINNPDSSAVAKARSGLAYVRNQFDAGLNLAQEAIRKELFFLQQQSSLSLFGDGSHPPMDVYDASETLIAVCKFLEDLKVPYFLSVGTLLGIIRDGELLPHDKDADLGIGWDVDREWLITQLEESEEFSINGTRPEASKAEWNFSVVRKGTPIAVDFFFHKPDGDHWLMGFDAAPSPWLIRFKQRPLTTVNYKGHLLPIPENPEGYLEEVYGPDWRIPMPSYDTVIAASNLYPESYLSTKIIGYSRLYEALRKRSWKKVLWYCEALKRFDNPPILDELANWLRGAMPPEPPKN